MLPLRPDMSILDRMVLAVERVRDRMLRASAALEAAHVPYAIAGGNAVAFWVATIDASAVRNTPDVDILSRRSDLDLVATALKSAAFIPGASSDIFLDGPEAKPRDAVRVLIANEKVRPDHAEAAPDPSRSVRMGEPRLSVLSLEDLVRMKLTSYRLKDQVHLRDMLEVGLIDGNWPARYPPMLASRLQQLIATPES